MLAAASPGLAGGVTAMKSAPSSTVAPSLQLGGHGGDAVGFLHAPAGDVAQPCGAVGVQRHGGQGHGRVGDVVAVRSMALQRPGAARDMQPVRAAGDRRRPWRVPLRRSGCRPWIESRPTPWILMPFWPYRPQSASAMK